MHGHPHALIQSRRSTGGQSIVKMVGSGSYTIKQTSWTDIQTRGSETENASDGGEKFAVSQHGSVAGVPSTT